MPSIWCLPLAPWWLFPNLNQAEASHHTIKSCGTVSRCYYIISIHSVHHWWTSYNDAGNKTGNQRAIHGLSKLNQLASLTLKSRPFCYQLHPSLASQRCTGCCRWTPSHNSEQIDEPQSSMLYRYTIIYQNGTWPTSLMVRLAFVIDWFVWLS